MSLIAIMARCTTIQFADCDEINKPLFIRQSMDETRKGKTTQSKPNLASLVAGLEGRALERRLQGLHRLRPARAAH
jgi:hypothetical protein